MDKKLQSKNKMITSLALWKDVASYFEATLWLGLDTEFMRERTYYPQLCLVQLSCNQLSVCLDPLAFDCIPILSGLLSDKNVIKIIHSASQDIEVLGYYCNCEIHNIYDTQLAAEFCDIVPQIGYASLVNSFLDIELPKSQTRSNWAKRPLSDKQVEYSFNDVIYLKLLLDGLNQKLTDSGKEQWFKQEQHNELARMQQFRVDPDLAYLNFKSSHRLEPRNQQVLKVLVNWRERIAQQTNKPKNWILTDKSLAEVGAKLPACLDALKNITHDDRRFNNRYLQDILECISQGLNQPVERVWPYKVQLTEAQKQDVSSLRRKLENKAHQYHLPVTRLATRKDVVGYVCDGSGKLVQGWRKEILETIL